jgi:hypothetical protein
MSNFAHNHARKPIALRFRYPWALLSRLRGRKSIGKLHNTASQKGENRSINDWPDGVFWTRLMSPRPP